MVPVLKFFNPRKDLDQTYIGSLTDISYITLAEHKVDKYKQYPFVSRQPVTMGHKSVLSICLTSQWFYFSVI